MEKCLHIIPRKIAKERGLKRYFTGKPCKKGGHGERFTGSAKCYCEICRELRRGAHRKYSFDWRKRNPEKAKFWQSLSKEERQSRSRSYSENVRSDPERRAALLRRERLYRKLNPERYSQHHRAWRAANKEKLKAIRANRRSREMSAQGSHNSSDIKKIMIGQENRCASCHCNLKKTGYHVDHVIPLSRGGTNWPDNLQILCPTCNLSKGAKDPIEWAQENGRLL